jgi:WD40 repeat protein
VQHLLCTSTSLRQAGGQHRMVLRGHTAAVRHLAISSDGRDVLTASDDGTVQVGGVRKGSRNGRSGWGAHGQWQALWEMIVATAAAATIGT